MEHEFVYCIDCEEMVEAQEILCGKGHLKLYPVFDDIGVQVGSELDCCEMRLGFVSCPPPEAPDMELIACFDRPYTVDLLENQEQAEVEETKILLETGVINV